MRKPPAATRKAYPYQEQQTSKRAVEITAAKKIQSWFRCKTKQRGNQSQSLFSCRDRGAQKKLENPEEEQEEEEEEEAERDEERQIVEQKQQGKDESSSNIMATREDRRSEEKEEEKEGEQVPEEKQTEMNSKWGTTTAFTFQSENENQNQKQKQKQKQKQNKRNKKLADHDETLNHFPKFDQAIYDPLEDSSNSSCSDDEYDDDCGNVGQYDQDLHGKRKVTQETRSKNPNYTIKRNRGIQWKDHHAKNNNYRSRYKYDQGSGSGGDLCSVAYFSKHESVDMLKNSLPSDRKMVPNRGILAVKLTDELKRKTTCSLGVISGPDDEGDFPRNSIVGRNTMRNSGHWRSIEQVQLQWFLEYT